MSHPAPAAPTCLDTSNICPVTQGAPDNLNKEVAHLSFKTIVQPFNWDIRRWQAGGGGITLLLPRIFSWRALSVCYQTPWSQGFAKLGDTSVTVGGCYGVSCIATVSISSANLFALEIDTPPNNHFLSPLFTTSRPLAYDLAHWLDTLVSINAP